MVVLFHFHLAPYAEAGFLGVDVFFVISGFLITGIIVSGTQNHSFRLVHFYGNRIRRLAPALIATLLMTLAAGYVWLFPIDFRELSLQALMTQFYASNFYYWRNVNYFGLSADGVYLLHTWTLAVEEQFYLLYPVVLLAVLRVAPRLLWPLIWAGGLASFALNLWFVTLQPEATFYLLPTRAWELLAGAVCYQLVAKQIRPKPGAMEGLGLLGAGLIVVSIFCFEKDFSIPGSYAGLAVLGGAAIIYSGTYGPTAVSRALGWPAMAYVGRLSYPLYLVHWPIDVFAHSYFEQDYGVAVRAGMLGLSFGIAAIIYHFIESPIRKSGGRTRPQRLLLAYAVSVATTVGVYVASEATKGLPGRFPEDVLRMAAFAEDHTESSVECAFDKEQGVAASLCVIGAAGVDPTWMIYGDSHAWAGRTLFDEWLKRRGESGQYVFQGSCPPLSGVYLFGAQGNCYRFNKEVVELVLASEKIGNVLLVSTWREAIEERLSTSAYEMISRDEGLALFERQFSQTVSRYAAEGKRVHVWEPLPWATANVPQAVARAMLAGEANPQDGLSVSNEEYRAAFGFFFEVLAKNRGSIARTYAPSDVLCDDHWCRVMLDGVPAFFDSSHLTKSPYRRWVAMMEETDRRGR